MCLFTDIFFCFWAEQSQRYWNSHIVALVVCLILLCFACNFLCCHLGQVSYTKEVFDLRGTYLDEWRLTYKIQCSLLFPSFSLSLLLLHLSFLLLFIPLFTGCKECVRRRMSGCLGAGNVVRPYICFHSHILGTHLPFGDKAPAM